jgi:D-glycero-alpha-D-manno-heptose 1-phosphate guanylyltransferase
MKAIILAGGVGTRLKSVITDIPKPMAPVQGKPFLEYLIYQLKNWGYRDIVLSVGYLKDNIISYFGDGKPWGVSIEYSKEDLPLGTGGAIREAMSKYKDTTYLVLNGDSFYNIDFESLWNFHRVKSARASMAIASVEDASRYGSVTMNDFSEVISFGEKEDKTKGTINAGIYILTRSVLDNMPPGTISFEKEILPQLIQKGLFGSIQQGFFIDIGVPDDYNKFKEYIWKSNLDIFPP